MLIGSRDLIAIELHPLVPDWEIHYPPEKTGWAQFAIWADGNNLCRNVIDGSQSVQEHINVPLGHMADWLVQSWTAIGFEERPDRFPPRDSAFDTFRHWGNALPPESYMSNDEEEWFDAREQWWQRHFLAAGSDGAEFPNISLFRGGDRLFIEWNPAELVGSPAPKFHARYGQASVQWDEGEAVFAKFVAHIAEWFRKENLGDVFSWARLKDPLHEAEIDFQKRLNAFTGVETGILHDWTKTETEEDLRRELGIPADSDDPSESVITQVLRDLPPTMPESVRHEVWNLDKLTRKATDNTKKLGNLRNKARGAANTSTAPEESGQRAAQEVRKSLDLNGMPFKNISQFMQGFGVEVVRSEVDCTSERMLVGARRELGAVAIVNRTPRTRTPWGERFELARALGHLLVDSYRADALGAASTTFTQPWARRCSGAFAAELLLPSEHLFEKFDVLDSAASSDSFRSLLNAYGVGARTAAYQLWNQGLLSSPQIRDELIDDFSTVE